jgi:GNAT superfamily N-acetyltransferase
MDIRQSTVADHDELYRLYRETIAVDNPRAVVASPRVFAAFDSHPFPDQLNERYAVRADGRLVGMLVLEAPTAENTDRAYSTITIHPDHRRRGYGTAIHDFVVGRARELDRTILGGLTVVAIEGCPIAEPGSAFVQRLGYQPALPEVARRLDLTTVDEAEHDRLLADAWAAAAGYRTVRWVGVPPDDLIEDAAYLDSRLLTDAPMGDMDLEPEKITPDRIRDREAGVEARGRQTVNVGAIHEASGKLVAWTTICLDPELDNGQAMQWITLVDPDHRGHRLGTIIKIENLRYARTLDPKMLHVTTWNAAANGYMIRINEALGFRPAYGQMEWKLALS